MSLQDKLDNRRKEFESSAPPEKLSIMHRATNDLLQSGIMEQVLKAGDQAPDFSLPDEQGNLVDSQKLLRKGPLVVSFYRGAWWPYCNLELEALQAISSEIEALGASIVMISPQLKKYSKQVSKKNNLTFRVLSDQGNTIASLFGLVYKLPDDLRELYSSFGIDLAKFNGNDSWTLPMPGRFILNQQGTILSAGADPDYTKRPEPSDIIEILKSLEWHQDDLGEPAIQAYVKRLKSQHRLCFVQQSAGSRWFHDGDETERWKYWENFTIVLPLIEP